MGQKIIDGNKLLEKKHVMQCGYNFLDAVSVVDIQSAPAIDLHTHAHWIDHSFCSNCGGASYRPVDDHCAPTIYEYNPSDFCPDCGLQPYYTIIAQEYTLRGISTAWYNKLIERAKRWGRETKPRQEKTVMGGQWMVGGPFWLQSKAEAERRDDKRIRIDAKLAEIDRAKQYYDDD